MTAPRGAPAKGPAATSAAPGTPVGRMARNISAAFDRTTTTAPVKEGAGSWSSQSLGGGALTHASIQPT